MRMLNVASLIRPAAVVIWLVISYVVPAVPPENHMVAVVVVLVAEPYCVIPVGTVHVDVLMVSASSHSLQST